MMIICINHPVINNSKKHIINIDGISIMGSVDQIILEINLIWKDIG